jgi:hypothetical protein
VQAPWRRTAPGGREGRSPRAQRACTLIFARTAAEFNWCTLATPEIAIFRATSRPTPSPARSAGSSSPKEAFPSPTDTPRLRGGKASGSLRNAGRPHLSHRSLREPAGRSWADRRPGGYSRQPPLRSRRSPSRRSQSGSCLTQELGVEAHVSFEAIIHPATRSYKAKGKRPPRWAAACPLSPSPTLHSPRATGGDGRPRWMPCRTVPIAPEDRGAVAAPSPPDVADRLSPSSRTWCFPMCCV